MTLCASGPPPILGGGKLVEVGWGMQKFYSITIDPGEPDAHDPFPFGIFVD